MTQVINTSFKFLHIDTVTVHNPLHYMLTLFQYYAHREKLRLIGRENDLDAMNRSALQMAREVADKHGCLMAGNISNTTAYVTDDPESHKKVEEIFKV